MEKWQPGVHQLHPTINVHVLEGRKPGPTALVQAGIHGDEIAFTVGATSYKGRVEDDYRIRLSGTGGSKPVEWTLQPAPRR